MGAGSASSDLEGETPGNGIVATTSSARNRLRNQFRSVVISPSPPSSQVTPRVTPTNASESKSLDESRKSVGDAFNLMEFGGEAKRREKLADPNFVDNAPVKEQSGKKISVRNLLAKATSNPGRKIT